ncbi:CPBP family intramembrane glutamic endopeptidase [Sphingobacterium sp. HMA12]|jgi:membrane protease YdiL (CAAX protease family)|uniref:CPBP family intramembrane glutamic endopeptidase n=1 Tax=Sphingobacterium sp. HMA12 TaxID=2050894 RepID=UPI000CEA68C9|nr:type II CAAX endopeptidase family protein [Sphingobacterium sp. HMA12]
MKRLFTCLKVIVFYLLTLVFFVGASAITKQTSSPDLFSIILASILTFILVYGFVRNDKDSLSKNGLGIDQKTPMHFVSGFCIGIIMVLIMTLIVSNFSGVSFIRSQTFNPSILAVYIPLFLFVAFREELVFRTYILWRLKANNGPLIAMVIVTAIFIAEHLLSGYSAANAFIGSGLGAILFGFATLRTGNIALSAGIHFAWNLTHWFFGFKDNTGLFTESVLRGTAQQAAIIAFIGYTVAMIIGICAVYIFFIPRKNKHI